MEKPDPLLPPCPSPSLFNHTKMHHPVTVIKFHNYIKSAFNLSNVLAWSINLYLFVVWIKNLACCFAGIIPSQRETCRINQIQSVTALYKWKKLKYNGISAGNKMI